MGRYMFANAVPPPCHTTSCTAQYTVDQMGTYLLRSLLGGGNQGAISEPRSRKVAGKGCEGT